MTYRELVYMVADELKLISDDTYYTEEHIMFLLKRFRAYLLYQKYMQEKVFKALADNNEQDICLELEPVNNLCQDPMLKSTKKIPQTLDISNIKVSLVDQFSGEVSWVPVKRFNFVGSSKFAGNLIYATKGDDHYLYVKSSNPQILYLKKIKVTGIFEDPEEAEKYSCDSQSGDPSESECDIMDREFPIEDSLSILLIQAVVKELAAPVQAPKDDTNNASDDMSELAYFIRKNMKNEYQRKLNN